jgi:hypothetical protein
MVLSSISDTMAEDSLICYVMSFGSGAVSRRTGFDRENRDDFVVEPVSDPVSSASCGPVSCVRFHERFVGDLGLVPQISLDEFPSCGGDMLRQVLGELRAI